MRITASQAVKTTAKLQTVGKQLSFIGSNLLKGKYASVDELKRVRASVVNASNIARRANDQILDSISSVDELKDVISCGDADVMDKALEGSLEVATRAAMLCKAIDGELENLEPEEDDVEVSDEILDDEGADVEASESEDEPEVTDDEVTDDEVLDNEASEDDSIEDEPEADDIEDEVLDNEAGEDDEVEEVEAPIVAKKKAAVATKKASVIKKQASVRGGISWTMPSLPEAKRR